MYKLYDESILRSPQRDGQKPGNDGRPRTQRRWAYFYFFIGIILVPGLAGAIAMLKADYALASNDYQPVICQAFETLEKCQVESFTTLEDGQESDIAVPPLTLTSYPRLTTDRDNRGNVEDITDMVEQIDILIAIKNYAVQIAALATFAKAHTCAAVPGTLVSQATFCYADELQHKSLDFEIARIAIKVRYASPDLRNKLIRIQQLLAYTLSSIERHVRKLHRFVAPNSGLSCALIYSNEIAAQRIFRDTYRYNRRHFFTASKSTLAARKFLYVTKAHLGFPVRELLERTSEINETVQSVMSLYWDLVNDTSEVLGDDTNVDLQRYAKDLATTKYWKILLGPYKNLLFDMKGMTKQQASEEFEKRSEILASYFQLILEATAFVSEIGGLDLELDAGLEELKGMLESDVNLVDGKDVRKTSEELVAALKEGVKLLAK